MDAASFRLAPARPYMLLLGLCLLLYLPGQARIPVLDRDEARFAQATRQMLQTGDLLHIRFQNAERNAKPPGIYWLQAASVGALSTPASTAIWPYRLPSLAGATAAALLLFGFGKALCSGEPQAAHRTAFGAAVLLATALGVVAEAHIAKTDAMLLAATTAGQSALGLAYVRTRRGSAVAPWIAAVFWGAEIVAVYLKGPVGPGFAGLTIAVLSIADRDAGWLRGLRPALGVAALAAAVAPWLIAIEHATAGRFLAASMGHDFLGKLRGAEESHGAPPLSYLALAFVTFWPGSLLLVPAVLRAWRRRREVAERFLLAWLVPGWVCLELAPTKLPHYVLPLYPALALLAAAALVDAAEAPAAGWARRAELAGLGAWGVVGMALAATLVELPRRFGDGPAAIDLVGVVLVLGLVVALCRGRLAAPVSSRMDLSPGGGACPSPRRLRRLLRISNVLHSIIGIPPGEEDGGGRRNPSRTVRQGGATPSFTRSTTALVAGLALAFAVPAAVGVLPALDRLWLSRSAAALVAAHPAATRGDLVAVGYSEPSLVFLLDGKVELLSASGAAAALAAGNEALVGDRETAAFRAALANRGLAAKALGSVSGLDYSNGKNLVLTLYAIDPL